MKRKLCSMLLVCLPCVSWATSVCSSVLYDNGRGADQVRNDIRAAQEQQQSVTDGIGRIEDVDLLAAKSKLDESQKQLETLQAQLAATEESSKVKAESMKAQDSLAKANQSLQEYEREVKGQIRSLTWQRNLLGVLIIVAAARKISDL